MAKEKGQHNQRYSDTFFDQHKREYYANCEKETNDPVGLSFGAWSAPLEPAWARGLLLPPLDDREVVVVVPRGERNRIGYQLRIDYDRWLQKVDERNAARQTQILEIAQERFKGADLLKVIEEGDVPPELLKYIGPEAMPPREAILAMKHGDAWALGRSGVIPEKAKPILERMRRAHEAMRTVSVSEDSGNPFADDDEEETPNPFASGYDEKLADLEEQFDPEATGGTVVKNRRGRR